MKIHRILISGTGRTFLQENKGDNVHTQYGEVQGKDIDKANNGTLVYTNKKTPLTVIEPTWIDRYKRIKRGAQIVKLKDAGLILATAGLGPESIVAEAGSGSGALTAFLARHCKQVYSYDINANHQATAKKNIEDLELKNVTFKTKDITELTEKQLDCLILDIPEPWTAFKQKKNLKPGGYIVTYIPSTTQLKSVREQAEKEGLFHTRSVELTERHWMARGEAVRPTSRNTAFTAFISFFRYLGTKWEETRPPEVVQRGVEAPLPTKIMQDLF